MNGLTTQTRWLEVHVSEYRRVEERLKTEEGAATLFSAFHKNLALLGRGEGNDPGLIALDRNRVRVDVQCLALIERLAWALAPASGHSLDRILRYMSKGFESDVHRHVRHVIPAALATVSFLVQSG